MNPDTQYFVEVSYKWGKVGAEDGKQTTETDGHCNWSNLSYEQSVALQATCVVPGFQQMLGDAIAMGVELTTTGTLPTAQPSAKGRNDGT